MVLFNGSREENIMDYNRVYSDGNLVEAREGIGWEYIKH